jgi:polyhydroxyalkanoate synthesis regulator phasin
MTEVQAIEFIDNSKHALDYLFKALDEYYSVLVSAQKTVEEIESSEKALADLFVYRDQWSPNVNHHYVQFIERMKELDKQKTEASKDIDEKLNNALASIGATVESMSSLAGSVLQIAKQVLSLRHAGKPVIATARNIGSQSIVEVVWEGRNHSMHWDEGAPRARVQKMLDALSKDLGITIEVGKNNCLSILSALRWTSSDHVVLDLKLLVK